MIIVLTDGEVMMPTGEVDIKKFGYVSIRNNGSEYMLPLSQIKWMYEAPDGIEEIKMYEKLKTDAPKTVNFNTHKTNDELVKDFYPKEANGNT